MPWDTSPRAVGEAHAGDRHRDLLPGRDVGSAAHDLARRLLTDVDAAQRELVGIGMLRASFHPSHADGGEVGTELLDRDVLEAAHLETLREQQIVRQIDELAEPLERNAHQTCSSTRTSPSKR
jgi:hypothetical protein